MVSIVLAASLLAPPTDGAVAGSGETTGGSSFWGAAGASGTGSACAAGNLIGHSRPYLTNFTVLDASPPFYAVPENGSVSATLTVTPADMCTGTVTDAGRAQYLTQNGSAGSGDFTPIGPPAVTSGPMCVEIPPAPPHDLCPAASQETIQVALSVANDTSPEPAVESFLFDIVGGTPFPPSSFRPTEAPVHIIDNDGTARISLEPVLDGSATKAYVSGEPNTVRVPVFWAGPGPPQSVDYSVEPGTPAPTEGVDYRVQSEDPLPASAFNRAGDRLAVIEIGILNNAGPDGKPAKELNEIIEVELEDGTGYDLEPGRASTTITIRDGGSDTIAPRTRFHHPKHKKRYRRDAYQLREMHIFYVEKGGSEIQKAQIAIQRKMKSGRCQWWTGKRFRRGKCKRPPAKFWKRTQYDRFLDWFLYRVPSFKPTVRTNVRFYRAFSRGFDHAGNVETRFVRDRNKNKFWIKRR